MDNSINPFIKIDPLFNKINKVKDPKEKDILVEFQQIITLIKDKHKLLVICNLLTQKLNSM